MTYKLTCTSKSLFSPDFIEVFLLPRTSSTAYCVRGCHDANCVGVEKENSSTSTENRQI